MFRTQSAPEVAAASKAAFRIGGLLGWGKKEELDTIIESRLEGLSEHLDASLPTRGCFRH